MEPQQIVTIAVAVIGLVGIVVTYYGTRGKTKSDAKTALDARIDARVKTELERVWARLDSVEKLAVRRSAAFARILRAIADQWPGSHGPDLDPVDIAEIEDTIPPQWIRRGERKDTP